MTQNERLDYLVGSFKDESPEYKRVRIPEDTEGKQDDILMLVMPVMLAN